MVQRRVVQRFRAFRFAVAAVEAGGRPDRSVIGQVEDVEAARIEPSQRTDDRAGP